MKKIVTIVFTMLAVAAFAQDSLSVEEIIARGQEGQGVVVINQDARIAELIERHIAINKANEGKVSGWRVQIYNSSGTNSRSEAQNARKIFLSKYPDVGAYLIYQPPFFKIRVGDFRTKAEAYAFYKMLIVDFPVSYLVTDQINLPKLIESTPNNKDLESLLQGGSNL
ncbi:MAG: SPOR domain-containing protein [Bacteroidales bacterium]|nr:SPOR domain-containing protein [Bacteroidales bacterium]